MYTFLKKFYFYTFSLISMLQRCHFRTLPQTNHFCTFPRAATYVLPSDKPDIYIFSLRPATSIFTLKQPTSILSLRQDTSILSHGQDTSVFTLEQATYTLPLGQATSILSLRQVDGAALLKTGGSVGKQASAPTTASQAKIRQHAKKFTNRIWLYVSGSKKTNPKIFPGTSYEKKLFKKARMYLLHAIELHSTLK
jgi:hypothetical protein